VPRHHGQDHDEFVFYEFVQVELTAQHQQVFFTLAVQSLGRGLVGHETELALHFQRQLRRQNGGIWRPHFDHRGHGQRQLLEYRLPQPRHHRLHSVTDLIR
jgi:hypothetical protein